MYLISYDTCRARAILFYEMPDSFRCLESGSKLVRALPKTKTRFHGSRKCFPLKHVLHVKAVLHNHEFVLINSVPDSYLKVCTLGQRNFCLGSLEAANCFLQGLRLQ